MNAATYRSKDTLEPNIAVGLRLKLAMQKLTEIETIVVRKSDYLSDPMQLIATTGDDWETCSHSTRGRPATS